MEYKFPVADIFLVIGTADRCKRVIHPMPECVMHIANSSAQTSIFGIGATYEYINNKLSHSIKRHD